MSEPLKPYLELSDDPVRFEAVNQVTNVFFDDSNKQFSSFKLIMPTRKVVNEKKVSLTNLRCNDSIYYSAKPTNTRKPLSNESDIFITANGSDECKLETPNKKKISSKYFTPDETNNNQDIVEIFSNKKKTNFDAYIEEIVKQKRRSIQSLDDSLIRKTPIDIFNDELFSKTREENSNDITLSHVNGSIENKIEPLRQFKRRPPKTAPISPNKIKGYRIKRFISNIGLRICDNNMLREDNSIDFDSSYCKNNNIISVSNTKLDTQVLQSTLKSVESSRKVLPSSKPHSNGVEDEDVIFVDNSPPKAQNLNKEFIFNNNVKRSSLKRITTCSNFSEPIIIDDGAEELCTNMSFTKSSNSQRIQSQILLSETDLLSSGWLNKYHQTMFTCVICKSKFVGRKAYRSHLHAHK